MIVLLDKAGVLLGRVGTLLDTWVVSLDGAGQFSFDIVQDLVFLIVSHLSEHPALAISLPTKALG